MAAYIARPGIQFNLFDLQRRLAPYYLYWFWQLLP